MRARIRDTQNFSHNLEQQAKPTFIDPVSRDLGIGILVAAEERKVGITWKREGPKLYGGRQRWERKLLEKTFYVGKAADKF